MTTLNLLAKYGACLYAQFTVKTYQWREDREEDGGGCSITGHFCQHGNNNTGHCDYGKNWQIS